MTRMKKVPQIEMSPIRKKLLKNAFINPARLYDIEQIHDEFDEPSTITKLRPDSSFFNTMSVIPKEWTPFFPFLYKFSSFFYAASAIHEIYVNETIGTYSTFARLEAPTLLVQSILSFLSDTVYAGETSIFHLLDRCCASLLTLWFVAKCIYMDMDTFELTILTLTLVLGLTCFYLCRVTLKQENFKGFVTCKIFWHFLLPAGGSTILAYRMGQF